MKKLFLTSSVHAVAHSIGKKVNLAKGNKLVFIDTAAEPEEGDKQWLIDDQQALSDAGFEVTAYTITDKNKNQLKSELVAYDYIYMSGGNTFYLLRQAQQSGFTEVIQDLILKSRKTYIGTSAGSIIAGPQLPAYLIELDDPKDYGTVDATAFSFVNFIILPHWGSPDFKKRYLEGRIEIAYKIDQYPLVLLTDTQYVEVTDNAHKIIDVERTS